MTTIGLMGCLLDNPNMGCLALSYSLINLLNRIEDEFEKEFEYIIFDHHINDEKIQMLCEQLKIDRRKISVEMIGNININSFKDLLIYLKHLRKNLRMMNAIKKCDLIIDITQGDSFSDIYGQYRFYQLSYIKKYVESKKIPFILGPQTYGPYCNTKVKHYAKKIIECADLVMSRDDDSIVYLSEFVDRNDIIATTDLAFSLPYYSIDKAQEFKIRIGINPSSLLSKKGFENTFDSSQLNCDYDQLISKLIYKFSNDKRYEVHLISHVGNEAIECFPGFNNVIYHQAFLSPIEAKSCISNMDIFIGSRMHATIASFSTGVVTIPLAYSKKFKGLFNALGYNYIIDLLKDNTNDAYDKICKMVVNYKKIENDVNICNSSIASKSLLLHDSLCNYIIENT